MAAASRVKKMRSKGQRSRSRGYQMRRRRGYAGRHDCLGFLLNIVLRFKSTIVIRADPET